MRKILFILLSLCLLVAVADAQYYGNSGPSVCTPMTLSKPGFSPSANNFPPIYDSVPVNATIHFQNYDTINFAGTTITMDTLTILQITGLPPGLCWATNKTDNAFKNSESGCIQITGITGAAPGQYQLTIYTKAVFTPSDVPIEQNQPFYYFIRVNSCGQSVVNPVDSTHELTSDTILLYSAAPYNQQPCTDLGISTIEQAIQSLSVFPNPMGVQSRVSFNSVKPGPMTERIVNLIGNVVYNNQLNVKAGLNEHVINKNGMAAGLYFYTITDGVSTFTSKLVITE